jgi:hypothetical protein
MKLDVSAFFGKSVKKIIKVLLKSDKKNRHFTWRCFHIYDIISLNSSQNDECSRQKLYRKSNHTFYVQ